MLASVVSLTIRDDPSVWNDAGFSVVDDTCTFGAIRLCFDGASGDGTGGSGIGAWTVLHPDEEPGPRDLDGLATTLVDHDHDDTGSGPHHPNRTTGLDHVVVSSPDVDRTTAALSSIGVEPRRTRDTTRGDAPLRQRFFRMGTIIELVGPPEGDPDGGPARFWGLALVSDDIDVTAAFLGDRLGPVNDAVQPGRRIATLRTRELGISVPVAFMTPHGH